jgi:hypothetical protein
MLIIILPQHHSLENNQSLIVCSLQKVSYNFTYHSCFISKRHHRSLEMLTFYQNYLKIRNAADVTISLLQSCFKYEVRIKRYVHIINTKTHFY